MNRALLLLRFISVLVLGGCSFFSLASGVSDSSSVSQYQAQSRVTLEASWQLRSERVIERERTTLWLTIASNHPISGLFEIEALQVGGLFSEMGDQPSYSDETRDGQRVYLSSYRVDVYPSRAGHYVLPELSITHTQGENDIHFSSDSFTLEVDSLPREAMGSISSSQYRLNQTVTLVEVMSGGVVTRTVTQTAADLPGYLIGQLPPMASFDASIELTHGRESNMTDNFRGALTGTKSSNLHYRFLEAGDYQLPAVNVQWWNNTTNQLETATIEAIDVVVTAPPPLPLKERMAIVWFELKQQGPIWWYQNQLWVYLIGLASALVFSFRRKIQQRVQRMIRRCEQVKQTSMYSVLMLLLASVKKQQQWQKAFYYWMRENNFYSMNRLPSHFKPQIDDYLRCGQLKRFKILQCVVNWEINQISRRWNLSDINPK